MMCVITTFSCEQMYVLRGEGGCNKGSKAPDRLVLYLIVYHSA